MGTYANIEDPDEMLHNAAFHWGLHCLLRQNNFRERNTLFFGEIVTCDPVKYRMDHADFVVYSYMENSIGLKSVFLHAR